MENSKTGKPPRRWLAKSANVVVRYDGRKLTQRIVIRRKTEQS